MEQEAQKSRRFLAVAFTVFIVFAAMLLFIFIRYKVRHTFSVQKWADRPERRINLTADLLDRYSLIGMTENQVTELLGPEDNNEQTSFKMHMGPYPPESTLLYYLGVDLMDGCWLILSMEDGVVVDIAEGYT